MALRNDYVINLHHCRGWHPRQPVFYPIPTKLEALKEEDLQFLAESAFADACAPGNPKEASVEDIKALIRKLM